MGVFSVALRVKQMLTPTTPASGENILYPKADNKWYTKSSAGTETLVGPGVAPGAITSTELADGAVVNAKLGTGAVDSTKIGFNSIYQGHITDGEVTLAKLNADTKNLAVGTPSLRKLGTGATDASAGDHTHAGLAPALNIKDEGTLITGTPTGMNFVGAGVAVAGTPEPTITIPGIPIGGIIMWPIATAPTNWLICDGSTFVAATYPLLYAFFSNSNVLPDLRDRYPIGAGELAVGTSDAIAYGSRQAAHNHIHTHTDTFANANTDLERQTNAATGGSAARLTGFGGTSPLHTHTISGGVQNNTSFGHPRYFLNFIIRAA